jgi:hypothetical protein
MLQNVGTGRWGHWWDSTRYCGSEHLELVGEGFSIDMEM